METKDYIIYNGMIDAARRVFNNVKCPAGEYTAKELSKNMLYKYFYKDSFFNNEIDNIFSVEFDGYKCSFPARSAFNICAEIETAWGIPSARRAKFVRAAEDAAPAVKFDVPAVSKTIINALTPLKDSNYTATKYICVDTARRAVIGCNGHVLTAVAVPEMYVNKDADFKISLHPNSAGRFCLDPVLFKSGKGNITINENGAAVNGCQTKEIFTDLNFPSWEKVLPAVSEDAAVILGKDFAALKKAILAAAKFSNTVNNVVILRAAKVAPEIEIIGYKENEKDPKIADQEKAQKIKLSAPVPFSFIIAINGKDINAVAAADKMYIINEKQPVIFTAANYFALLMPVQIDKTPYHDNFFNSPAANVEILDICKFPALDAPNSAAAVASVQDEETAAPAADSWENNLPRATVLFNDINLFAEDQRARLDEIRNAAPAAEDAPAVAVQDEEETAAPVAVAAEDETRPAFEDAAAAFVDEMPEYFNNLNLDEEEKARAAFAAAFADQETARAAAEMETAPAVQDEETAAPVSSVAADSLAAANIWGISPAVNLDEITADAPAVAAQIEIQNNCFTYHYILPGLIMKHKFCDNLYIIILDATNKGYKTKEIEIYQNSRRRAKLITKYYFKLDIQPGGKSLFDVCPAAEIGKVLNILAVQDKDIFNLAAPAADPVAAEDAPETAANVPAVSLPAAELETAPAVQDAAPAVSLPVPVSAVSVWYAVYNSANSLHGVYFSQLLADELLINSLFVPGGTWNVLTVQDPSAAPAEFVPAVASVQDEETAPAVQDEETAAPADSVPAADPVPAFASVFAIMPEIWETAAPADSVPFLDEEETAAPAADSLQAAEDAAPVAAILIAANFARRFRAVFNVAAAFFCLLLITAAPRFISPAVQELTAPAVAADSLLFAPETAPAVSADSLPAVAKKQPQTARKRARRVNPDNLAPAVAVSLPVAADSVPADSVPFVAAADSVPFLETAAPADSVPAARSVAADSMQTAQPAPVAVQDAAPVNLDEEETAAPAAEDEETETGNGAPVSSAEDAPAPANSPAPAAPGVSSVAAGSAPVSLPAVLLYLML